VAGSVFRRTLNRIGCISIAVTNLFQLLDLISISDTVKIACRVKGRPYDKNRTAVDQLQHLSLRTVALQYSALIA
jgi:molybdenum-dependent DNA-binding transcriptional regulator ModE